MEHLTLFCQYLYAGWAIITDRNLSLRRTAGLAALNRLVLLQMIRFDKRHAGRAVHIIDDGSVISRRQVDDDRRFQIARGRKTAVRDGDLLRVFPVIV